MAAPTGAPRAIIFVLALFLATFAAENDLQSLRLVTALWRHGDRSPTGRYNNDIYNESDWPQGFGQLSQEGMRQQQELGKWLRRTYHGFLNDSYIRTQVKIHCTDYDRTLMSAAANMAGLYPASGRQVWDVGGPLQDWQPIPLFSYYLDHNHDPLVASRWKILSCPELEKLRNQELHDAAGGKVDAENKEFYAKLTEWTGNNVTTYTDVGVIYDSIFCQKRWNRTIPTWAQNDTTWLRIKSLESFSMGRMCLSMASCRLFSGLLIKQMIEDMKSKISGENADIRFIGYSAHDTTQAGFMNALGTGNKMLPPYASVVLLELHQDEGGGQYFLKLYQKNGTDVDVPFEYKIAGCSDGVEKGSRCTFERFVSVTQPLMVDDWLWECGNRMVIIDLANDRHLLLLGAGASAIVLLLLVTLACSCMQIRRMKRRRHRFSSTNHKSPSDDDHSDTEYHILHNVADS